MIEARWQDESQMAPAARLRDGFRAACHPRNLLPGMLLVVGWLALIGWTGAGSDGWQARICAELQMQARSCGLVPSSDGLGVPAGERSSS